MHAWAGQVTLVSSEGTPFVVAEQVARRDQQGQRPRRLRHRCSCCTTHFDVGTPLTARFGVHAGCAASWTMFWKARTAARRAVLEFQLELGHVAATKAAVSRPRRERRRAVHPLTQRERAISGACNSIL